jgi:OFA family oxalate/formate antiporter-like MFS transporter
MPGRAIMNGTASRNRGWTVALSATGINLALGILYTWSIFKAAIQKAIETGQGGFDWDKSRLNDPYSICCLVFAFSMILAGKVQDRFGPRTTALLGGILVSSGLISISQSTSYAVWAIGFGVLVGCGIGFAYSATTPPALKWFPPARTGMIAGIVVSGFGLASVYIAPLSQVLIRTGGINKAMLFFGLGFLIVVCGLALLLMNPPPGYQPNGSSSGVSQPKVCHGAEAVPSQVLRSGKFYLLWLIYFIGAGAGLMVISNISGMAKRALGSAAFVAVAILAIGNASGRIVAGLLSDRIGRKWTLFIMLTFQALLMFVTVPVVRNEQSGALLIVVLATLIGFNYGTNLSIFPSAAKDAWGLRNFGMNYGLLFTAWGIGGFLLSRASQMLQVHSKGDYGSSMLVAGILLVAGALLTLLIPGRVRKPV